MPAAHRSLAVFRRARSRDGQHGRASGHQRRSAGWLRTLHYRCPLKLLAELRCLQTHPAGSEPPDSAAWAKHAALDPALPAVQIISTPGAAPSAASLDTQRMQPQALVLSPTTFVVSLATWSESAPGNRRLLPPRVCCCHCLLNHVASVVWRLGVLPARVPLYRPQARPRPRPLRAASAAPLAT
jgi:hypothetical protein